MLCYCHHVTRRCVCHTLGQCLKVRIPSGCKILDCQKMDDFLRRQHFILKRAPWKLVILETADSFVPGSLLTFLSPIFPWFSNSPWFVAHVGWLNPYSPSESMVVTYHISRVYSFLVSLSVIMILSPSNFWVVKLAFVHPAYYHLLSLNCFHRLPMMFSNCHLLQTSSVFLPLAPPFPTQKTQELRGQSVPCTVLWPEEEIQQADTPEAGPW